MSGNSEFVAVESAGWRTGLRNLFRAEMRGWWMTRTWWVQSLIWILAVDGLLLTVISAGAGEDQMEYLLLYGVFGGFFTAIGVIIVMQGAVVGEKVSGTAAWVLSKPVSRAAFILSKLAGNTIGIGLTAIVFPGLIAYLIFTFAAGLTLNVANFLAGLGVLLLFNLFWLSLTLMLGAFFNRRGAVIGIPLALVLGQQFFTGMLMQISEQAIKFLPFALVMPDLLPPGPSISALIIQGSKLQTWMPIYSTVAWIILFISLGVWRFNKEEL
jgi:ABC-2 type transport system permease protein